MSATTAIELCTGSVMHQRSRPRVNRFVYRVFFIRAAVEAIDDARATGSALFSINRFNLLSLHARDFGPRDGTALGVWARQLLAEAGVDQADGRIVLQAFPRLLGYVFNPISVWYCYDRAGQLRAAICEVNNTFGERHNYVLAHDDQSPIAPGDCLVSKKMFHVSPFCEVRGQYRYRFEQNDTRSFAQIDYHDGPDDDDRLIVTTIHGHVAPLTSRAVLRAFLSHPFLTVGVVVRIHWQALRLWKKHVPFFAKPTLPTYDTTRSHSP